MTVHKSVLLKETVEGLLAPRSASEVGEIKEGIVLDGTFGGGGHTKAVLEKYPNAKVIALDMDASAWERAKSDLPESKVEFHNDNFRNLDKVLGDRKVSGIILDLGLSSDQLESSGRGFTFMKDEPLLMTMKANPSPEDVTAKDIVNTWSQESLEKIIRGYGEEKFAGRIARVIVEEREENEIKTTSQLVEIVAKAVPGFYRRGKINPATKTFQALRIAVNDELGALQEGLEKGFRALEKGGRMAVITFHSLEDRVVKNFNKEKVNNKEAKLINKKPIVSGADEVKDNPRARSAKLRIIEKI